MVTKINVTILTIFLNFCWALNAQQVYDSISKESITVNQVCILYKNKSCLRKIDAFTTANSNKKKRNDFTKEYYTYKYFGKDIIEINKKGLITSFEIWSKNVVVTNNNISIGESFANFYKYFPLSYKNVRMNSLNDKYLKVSIIGQDDVYLMFIFKNDILITIKIWYDY